MDYYDTHEYINDYEYDPNIDYDEYDEYAYLDSDEYDDDSAHTDANQPSYVQEIWSQLCINQENTHYIVNVSNRGRVKPSGTFQEAIASNGIQLRGTPYMVTRIGKYDYYIHDLVWYAFVGPVPQNYVVRHKTHYIEKRAHKTYCNRVECLDIYLNTLSTLEI